MKTANIPHDVKDFQKVDSKILQQFILDCFLHHKIKLIRNWGSCDEADQLCFKDVTLLQFATPSCNFQICIQPKQFHISITHMTKRGRNLHLYFVKKLTAMIAGDYKPNF